jgi:hypothetical protein
MISSAVKLPGSSITVGPVNMAVCVKGKAGEVRTGMDQRDEAIKIGGMGATTLVFSGSKLSIPGVDEEFLKDDLWILGEILAKMEPAENDVIIIGSAEDGLSAELAARTAALHLFKSKK